jgi:hypothetical protein
MKYGRKIVATALVALMVLPVGAAAQRAGELTLFSEIGFRGRSYVVTGARPNIFLFFTVRSARLARGEAWELCSSIGFRGSCNVIREDQGNVAWQVASVRPSRAVQLPAPVPPSPGPGPVGQSLRGMTAEFFPQPSDRGGRVLSCVSGAAACATDAANRFCQSRGWNGSEYERQETVAGRVFLADVLCSQTANRR